MTVNIYRKNNFVWEKKEEVNEVGMLHEKINNYFSETGIHHWVFPSNVDPADYPLLETLEELALKYLDSYFNDFYVWDMLSYFNYSRHGIWVIDGSGTNYIPLGEPVEDCYIGGFKQTKYNLYTYHINQGRYFYLIKEDNILRLTRKEALRLIEYKNNTLLSDMAGSRKEHDYPEFIDNFLKRTKSFTDYQFLSDMVEKPYFSAFLQPLIKRGSNFSRYSSLNNIPGVKK